MHGCRLRRFRDWGLGGGCRNESSCFGEIQLSNDGYSCSFQFVHHSVSAVGIRHHCCSSDVSCKSAEQDRFQCKFQTWRVFAPFGEKRTGNGRVLFVTCQNVESDGIKFSLFTGLAGEAARIQRKVVRGPRGRHFGGLD